MEHSFYAWQPTTDIDLLSKRRGKRVNNYREQKGRNKRHKISDTVEEDVGHDYSRLSSHRTRLFSKGSRHQKYKYASNSEKEYFTQSPRRQRKRKIEANKDDHVTVYVGDVLAERYEVLRKLGEGGFSLVVECYDRQKSSNVAVKLQRAKYTTDAMYEIDTLELIRRESEKRSDSPCHVINLLDWFEYQGSVCMVFPLRPKSLLDYLNERGKLTLDEIKFYGRQLLETISFIHEMELTHTDIKPENMLLNSDGKRISVIDFGLAVFDDEYHSKVIGTRQYAGPEIILGIEWNYSLDIWSVGCTLAELYLGRPLFETHENLEHLALMEQLLGPIPKHLVDNASEEAHYKYFNEDKHLRWPNSSVCDSSVKFVSSTKSLQELIPDELFRGLISLMLRYDPDRRVSAAVALRHEFFS